MNSRRGAWTVCATVLLILVVLCPVFFIVQMSVRTGLEAFRMPPTLVFSPTLQNYVDLVEGKVSCGAQRRQLDAVVRPDSRLSF